MALRTWSEAHALDLGIDAPDDWPLKFKLEPARPCPLYGGDHAPGFVALYTVINGLSLLLAEAEPLTPADEQSLLEVGWKFLVSRGLVAPWRGVRANMFERLAEAMAFSLARRRGHGIRCQRLHVDGSAPQLAMLMERLIVSRKAVIVLLGGGQYTVLRGYTPLSWLLFDAAGRVWIKRSNRRGTCPHQPGHQLRRPFILIMSRCL